ncbi:MAG: nuclear transport factor 2 family protein [Gammaproteobacteria bacterium]|nr:nuclear transport factor 2 family protein [Gammaproteobacteria bacterium]MDC0465020.1 nuclear transport factor 2 family protein [Pseudomonadales bacterium]
MTSQVHELTTADRVEIHELPGRYGDAIDDRNWTALDTIFTPDAVFDLTGVGARICSGLDDIKSFMESEAAHPRTHMMTNVYTDSDEDGVTLRFRIVALIGKGRTSTASYYDKIVKTEAGWRTQHRFVSNRRRDKREAEVDRKGIAL